MTFREREAVAGLGRARGQTLRLALLGFFGAVGSRRRCARPQDAAFYQVAGLVKLPWWSVSVSANCDAFKTPARIGL